MVATLTAWHGDAALKAQVVARMIEHRQRDEIVRGRFQWIDPELASGYKGCLIGCTLPRQHPDGPLEGWHKRVEIEYGIPEPVGLLLDTIFEKMEYGGHADFAVASVKAPPVGADLSMIPSRLTLDLLISDEMGALRHTPEGSVQQSAVERVVRLYQRRLAGDEPTIGQWREAKEEAVPVGRERGGSVRHACGVAELAAFAGEPDGLSVRSVVSQATLLSDGVIDWMAGRMLHHLSTAPMAR